MVETSRVQVNLGILFGRGNRVVAVIVIVNREQEPRKGKVVV